MRCRGDEGMRGCVAFWIDFLGDESCFTHHASRFTCFEQKHQCKSDSEALFFGLTQGEGDDESGSVTWLTYGRNGAVVPLDNFAADGQTHARTAVFCAGVQTLKDGKNLFGILHIKTNPVVTDLNLAPGLGR